MRQVITAVSLVLLLLSGFGCSKGGSSSGGGSLPKCSQAVSGQNMAWDAPVHEDGTPVQDVAGYNIYYGAAPGTYSGFLSTGTSTTTYSLFQLQTALTGSLQSAATGTYYLAVTARDAEGKESAFSNEICRVF